MYADMLKRRAAEPTKTKGKKRKAAIDAEHPSTKKKATVNSSNAGISTATRAIAASLAEEETKRKANMSDAVKSLYTSKDGPRRKETFMTMGTFTRVRRILCYRAMTLSGQLFYSTLELLTDSHIRTPLRGYHALIL